MKGGPKLIKDCPHSIQSYWYFRDQITCEDGIIYKGTRLIIPKSERASALKVLHMGHYAINKMSLRARETVYWPGISEDIRSTYHITVISALNLQELNKGRHYSILKHHKPFGNNWD